MLEKANDVFAKENIKLAAEQAAFEDVVDGEGKVTKKGTISTLFE